MRRSSSGCPWVVVLRIGARHFPTRASKPPREPPVVPLAAQQFALHAAIGAERRRRMAISSVSPDAARRHLAAFQEGATYFVTRSVLDWRGREWLGYDDNSQFVMPRSEADRLLAKARGDVGLLEIELGIPPGSWAGAVLLRIDIPAPHELNLRLPSGNEAGANACWLPGGLTPFGHSEAVVDRIPLGKYVESPAWNIFPPEPTTGSSTSTAAASSPCCAEAPRSMNSGPN